MQPAELLSRLCCPRTRGPLTIVPSVVANDMTYEGVIVSERLDDVVGSVRQFKFDFLPDPSELDKLRKQWKDAGQRAPERRDRVQRRVFIDRASHLWEYRGRWGVLQDRLSFTEDAEASVTINVESSRVEFELISHPWSGFAEVLVDGRPVAQRDLYHPGTSIPIRLAVEVGEGSHLVTLRPTGARNASAFAGQVILVGLWVQGTELVPLIPERSPVNLGNPFPERFKRLVEQVPSHGVILDDGGGLRRLDDPRYVNLEYSKYDEPDLYADGLQMPLKDDSVDLVLSQGVLEHMPDPFQATREMFRVCKPGGIVYADAAFLQPVHSEPHHYFNMTVWGIEQLFRNFVRVESGGEGGLVDTVTWILNESQTAGNDPTAFAALQAALARLGPTMSPSRLAHCGMAVYFVGRKA